MELSRPEYWSGLLFPSPGDLPKSGTKPRSHTSQANYLPYEQPGKPISSVQSLSCVQLFVTPWTAPHQASLSITNSRSPPKSMSIESMMPSNHLILCCPLLLLPFWKCLRHKGGILMNRISALSKRLQGDAQVLPPHKQLELWPEKGPCPDMLAPWSQPSSLQNCKQQISALYKLPSLGILLQQPKQAKILWTHTHTHIHTHTHPPS